jgi:ferredoxin-NADP reductase
LPTPVKLPARIAEVIAHADDLRSYVLAPARPVPAFRPGQFLHLALDAWDPSAHWPESRVFSIASSPLQRTRLRITVSRQGAFTTRMFEQLAVSSTVWLKLPYGAFSPDATGPGRVVLLAGGTGITPFVSFLEWAQERHPQAAIDLHYGARSPGLLVYRDQVAKSGLANLRVQLYAEHIPEGESSQGLVVGRLSPHAAWDTLENPDDAHFYLSGPKTMIDAFRHQLLVLGARPERVLSDDWG